MKQYARQPDDLADPDSVLEVMRQLATRLKLDFFSDEKLIKLAHSIHNFLKYSPKTLGRGRKGAFERPLLSLASSHLTQILAEASGNRISQMRFFSRYLPILKLPGEIKSALVQHQITLEEAHLLARLSPRNLKGDAARAKRLRRDLLEQHTKYQMSQNRLRERVREILGEKTITTVTEISDRIKQQVAKADELLEIDAYDTTHLLFEEIKNLFFMAREVEDEDLDDKLTKEILDRIGDLQAVLQKALTIKSKRLIESEVIHLVK